MTKQTIKKISITSIFLSMAIIFSYLSTWMPLDFLSPFLKINLSSIFLGIILLSVNFKYAVFSTIVSSFVQFAGASPSTTYVGVLINMISNLIFISILFIINKLLLPRTLKKSHNLQLGLKKYNVKWHYASEILTVLLTSLTLTVLNGILFTPLNWYVFSLLPGLNSISFLEAESIYNSSSGAQVLMLGIPNYWAGIFALYMSFNLLNFSIVSIGISGAKIFIIESGVLSKMSPDSLGGLL